jgi:hypothetical protein
MALKAMSNAPKYVGASVVMRHRYCPFHSCSSTENLTSFFFSSWQNGRTQYSLFCIEQNLRSEISRALSDYIEYEKEKREESICHSFLHMFSGRWFRYQGTYNKHQPSYNLPGDDRMDTVKSLTLGAICQGPD